MTEDIHVGFEEAVQQPIVAQQSRMNCQTFATGLSSGHLDGSSTRIKARAAPSSLGIDQTIRSVPLQRQHLFPYILKATHTNARCFAAAVKNHR
jgi:hypothetical protein